MRTLEQRMAEIQSRKEALMAKNQKRRNAILATSIPLVLTLVLVGGYFLHSPLPGETELIPYEADTLAEVAVDSNQVVEEATVPAIFVESATAPVGSYTDYEGLTLEVLSLDRDEKGLSLRIKWKNETDKEVIFGAAFYIDRFRGGEWHPCDMEENVTFNALGYILPPNSEREETYRLTGVYQLPELGTCRFRTDCFVYLAPDRSTPCTLWTTFQIEK